MCTRAKPIVKTIEVVTPVRLEENTETKMASASSPKVLEVLAKIKKDKVVIFSKTYCPYCTMAKEVFEKLKVPYTAIELEDREDGDEIQNILGEMTGAKTVPRVFVNEKCLGGGSDVQALYDQGELQKILA